jgi:hypothetical protein
LDEWSIRYLAAIKSEKEKCEAAWSADQLVMSRSWAEWQRWRDRFPVAADEWRRQHQDETGDKNWLLGRPSSGLPAVQHPVRTTPSERCRWCGSFRFWRKKSQDCVCSVCHPPPDADAVVEWVEVPEVPPLRRVDRRVSR